MFALWVQWYDALFFFHASVELFTISAVKMNRKAAQAGAEDRRTLKDKIPLYAARYLECDGQFSASYFQGSKKVQRGYNSDLTARLLVPAVLQKAYEKNPDKSVTFRLLSFNVTLELCVTLLTGIRARQALRGADGDDVAQQWLTTSKSFSSFVYPRGGFNREAVWENLLRSEFVLSVGIFSIFIITHSSL